MTIEKTDRKAMSRMREKLIELLNDIGLIHEREAETVAEYLIDKGVIILPCRCKGCGMTSDIINHHPMYQSKDIVEVVRCKDCAFAEKQLDYRHIYLCLRIDRFVRSIDFCSFGERSEKQ